MLLRRSPADAAVLPPTSDTILSCDTLVRLRTFKLRGLRNEARDITIDESPDCQLCVSVPDCPHDRALCSVKNRFAHGEVIIFIFAV